MPDAAITHLTGDATTPAGEGPAIIAHVCNDAGAWGRGFVTAISKRWKAPEVDFRAWAKGAHPGFGLGAVRFVEVTSRIEVANMVGQHGYVGQRGRPKDAPPPVRYDAIKTCLATVTEHAAKRGASVHMPRIGCGFAGGRWEEIEPIIARTLLKGSIPVYVYEPPADPAPTR